MSITAFINTFYQWPSFRPTIHVTFKYNTALLASVVDVIESQVFKLPFHFKDTLAPWLECPPNQITTNIGSYFYQPMATVTDNGDAAGTSVTVNYQPPSGNFFNIGTSVVTVTATDRSGNSDSCIFAVTVNNGKLISPSNTRLFFPARHK